MNTSPSNDALIEGVILALGEEIAPNLSNPKALATIQMMQSLLQGVRQTMPIMDDHLVDEHNDMITTLRATGAALADAEGPAADRVRERADTLGSVDPLPTPPDRARLVDTHRELTQAIESTFRDLDELQRAGVAAAEDAVQVVRGHLAPRYLRQVEVSTVGEGFIGRS